MEPITHLMTGAVLARSGFNRKAAYATIVMVLAAEAPDLDTLWSFDGPIAGFQHHRGWTHTFLGVPFEAAILVGLFWLIHRWRTRPASSAKLPKAPVRWPLLYLFAVIALLSHLMLDWTNNYGLRPFFPFNPRWYAGSFVFIFDPVLFLILLSALVAPALFGLINSEVGARKPTFRGQNWAILGLLAVLSLWTWRFVEHGKALQQARTGDYNGAEVLRVFASPSIANPYRWHTIVETPQFYQLATANTFTGALATDPQTDPQTDIIYKPPTTLATLVAKRTWLGEVYLDWSSWPVVTETSNVPGGLTTVTFRDLRFLEGIPHLSSSGNTREDPPLSGAVTLNDDRRVVRMQLGNRIQH
jgi:inner membrane protein